MRGGIKLHAAGVGRKKGGWWRGGAGGCFRGGLGRGTTAAMRGERCVMA